MSEGGINGPEPNQRPDGKQAVDRAPLPRPLEGRTDDAAGRDDEQSGEALAQARRAQRTEPANEGKRGELDNAVSRLNDYVQSVQRDLSFEVHDETGQTVVEVIDPETDKVVRQIPDELALKLAADLQQEEPLTLLNIRV